MRHGQCYVSVGVAANIPQVSKRDFPLEVAGDFLGWLRPSQGIMGRSG